MCVSKLLLSGIWYRGSCDKLPPSRNVECWDTESQISTNNGRSMPAGSIHVSVCYWDSSAARTSRIIESWNWSLALSVQTQRLAAELTGVYSCWFGRIIVELIHCMPTSKKRVLLSPTLPPCVWLSVHIVDIVACNIRYLCAIPYCTACWRGL